MICPWGIPQLVLGELIIHLWKTLQFVHEIFHVPQGDSQFLPGKWINVPWEIMDLCLGHGSGPALSLCKGFPYAFPTIYANPFIHGEISNLLWEIVNLSMGNIQFFWEILMVCQWGLIFCSRRKYNLSLENYQIILGTVAHS